MEIAATNQIIHNTTHYVNPPELPSNYQEVAKSTYPRYKGVRAAEALAQGEVDILEMVRQALGWPSIYSLAYKWYPLYPHRHCWKRALARCQTQKLRTATLNIKYLLLAVITEVKRSLSKAFSGRDALNRLLQSTRNTNNKERNRLADRKDSLTLPKAQDDPDKYIKGKYGHMVLR